MLVGSDFRGSNAQLQAIAETVAQKDESLGIAKRQWAQEDAFNEREDGSGSPDAQREVSTMIREKPGAFRSWLSARRKLCISEDPCSA